jgi:hypothetical protein
MTYLSIKPKDNLFNFLRIRPEDSIPKSISSEIKFISFNKSDKKLFPKIYGSFSYIIQKYAADIDLYEIYYPKGEKEYAIKEFEGALLNFTVNIIKKRQHWFSEYKIGLDLRYDIHIGNLEKGYFYVNKDLLQISTQMFRDGLLSKNELKLIKTCVNEVKKNPHNSDAYDVIYNIFREHKILRWSAKEVLQRYKILPGNVKISLNQALHAKAHVKIDEIIYLNGRFMEITNYIFLGYTKNGQDIPINIPLETIPHVVEGLKNEIEKLYLSNFYYSPFKAVKRIFALSRILYLVGEKQYGKFLQKIIPFVSSDISYLYQLRSQLEAIIRVFIVSKSLPKTTINKSIDELKIAVSNMIELNDSIILDLEQKIDKIIITNKKKDKLKLIKELASELKNLINYYTINYFNHIKFNPPPKQFYLKPLKYELVKRTLTENPQDHKLIKLYKNL